MTSTNFHLRDRKERNPFLLKPVGKDYMWGGSRLNDDYSKGFAVFPLAESWECSTHQAGLSVVASGFFSGLTLKQVLKEHPEYLGTHVRAEGDIPILIKLIDAAQDLSIQVHPSDEYANIHENGQLGKTEMWYVLDAKEDAKLIYGLHHKTTKEELRKSISDGTIENYLLKVPVKRNDVFFINSGTIHAIGAGILLAEIQESSDLTYRMYDYNRVGADGRKRDLNIEKALDVADLSQSSEPAQPMRVLKYEPGSASELLCRCKYFQVERLLINTERQRKYVTYSAGSLSFQVLLCIDGCGTLLFGDDDSLQFFKGDCIFVPANSSEIKIHGKVQFLNVTC